jgi:hypothetical protein
MRSENFGELRQREVRRIHLPRTGVKIAFAAAPFSWLRGGPARAMGHLGEYGSPEKVQKPQVVGTGLRFIFLALFTTALSAGAALLISHPCTNIT